MWVKRNRVAAPMNYRNGDTKRGKEPGREENFFSSRLLCLSASCAGRYYLLFQMAVSMVWADRRVDRETGRQQTIFNDSHGN